MEQYGTFSIEIEPGKYYIVISKTSYLEYRITNIILEKGGEIALDDISILAGDIFKTDEIELDDLVALNSNYGAIEDSQKAEKAKYDLNEDGIVSKHTGIDLAGTHNTEILAVADEEVRFARVRNLFGNFIEIKHIINGETIYSFYAHLSRIDVKTGYVVKQGNVIGLEGGDPETDPNTGKSTGHHLHFETRKASGYGNDVNPSEYIKF